MIRCLFSILFLCVLALTQPSLAADFEIKPGDQGNSVVFESKAPIESFEGKTDQISGFFKANLSELTGPVSFHLEVDLTTLDTGIGLRNDHMRDNHLETDSYPLAVFRGDQNAAAGLDILLPGQKASMRLSGDMELHGVKQPMEVDVDLLLRQDGIVEVSSEFTLLLSDFEIKRPGFLVMKLADEQRVQVEFLAHPIKGTAGE